MIYKVCCQPLMLRFPESRPEKLSLLFCNILLTPQVSQSCPDKVDGEIVTHAP